MNIDLHSQNFLIPSRSEYQLKHFVIGQHDTPQMQWRQILIEAQDLAYKIKLAELDCKKKRLKIKKLISTKDPIKAIEAEEYKLGLEMTERTLAGARLEFNWLQKIAQEIGAYTLEEIEENQEEYWSARLQRQAGIDQLSLTQGISSGNLESLRLAGLLERQEDEQCAITTKQ